MPENKAINTWKKGIISKPKGIKIKTRNPKNRLLTIITSPLSKIIVH